MGIPIAKQLIDRNLDLLEFGLLARQSDEFVLDCGHFPPKNLAGFFDLQAFRL